MKNLAVVLTLLLGASISALAQSNQSRIVDLDGNGISGVEVTCTTTCYRDLSPPRSFSTSIVTDADGRFTWPDPDPIITDICVFVPPVNVFTLKKAGYIFTRTEFVFQPSGSVTVFTPYDDRLPLIQGTALPPLANVSAASFGAKPNQPLASLLSTQFMASEMILAGFGDNLAATTETAAGSLPTTLAGRKLLVKTGLAEIRKVSAGVFTADSDGQGVPAAIITRVKPGNVQTVEPVAQLDAAQSRFVPMPIDLGPETEFVLLTLFGTGWRQFGTLSNTKVTIGDVECPVEYVGLQPTFDGVDQINARLARALISKGDVEVKVSFAGISFTNPVKLNFK